MPPRALSRPPFAGIGSGAVQFPSPQRNGARSTTPGPSSHSASSTTSHTPTSYHHHHPNPPVAHHHDAASSHANGRIDYRTGNSAVSESLSKAYFYDVVLESDSTSASIDQDDPGVLLPWLGSVVVDQTGGTDDGGSGGPDPHADPCHMPKSASGSSINAIASTDHHHDGDVQDGRSRSHSAPSRPAGQFDPARFQSRFQELLDTERNYIRRIEALHQKYALPLRRLAKDRDTAIVPIYEAQRLFGNIGEIVGANQAFLIDLEALAAKGIEAVRAGLGDVVYRHMNCFSCYTEYFANFEKAKHIERTLAKHRGFQEFAERTKYATTGLGNVGLRDLLMEPVQRIPRYKLLLDGVIKHMGARDPQKGCLEDVVVLASRIASCEADDKTKRAAVLWSFNRNVDDFPAGLISVHRQFLDCIDVDDFPLEAMGGVVSPGGAGAAVSSGALMAAGGGKTIHCALFLFDDRLAIVKRASASICGRRAVGLDDLNRLADQMKTFTERSSGGSSSAALGGSRKGDLGFRGVVNILDLEALDLGGSDFQLNFFQPPSQVSGDRWTGRPVRQYVTADTAAASSGSSSVRGQPPTPRANFDNDTPARLEKTRFLESLWRAKALYKTKEHRSHVRCQILPAVRPHASAAATAAMAGMGTRTGCDEDLDAMVAAREAEARRVVYWNVYTRRSYLTEPHKAPLALHVNFQREADPLPFGPEAAPPHAALEVVHVDDAYGECQISTLTKLDDPEQHEQRSSSLADVTVVQCGDLALRMAQLAAETSRLMGGQLTLHTLSSQPATPSSHRTRVVAGIEQFGRSLLFGGGGGGGTPGLDVFGSPARRTKSNASKSTTYSSDVPSTSSRAMTFSTAATSVSSRAGMLESMMTGALPAAARRHHHGSAAESPGEGSFLGSPRRLMKKRRSSSVGPPSMASELESERSPGRGGIFDRKARSRATTPEPGYHLAGASSAAVAGSPHTVLRSSRLGVHGGGHQRAKTESFAGVPSSLVANRSPVRAAGEYIDDETYTHYAADVSREPSSSTQASRTSSNAVPVRATTPLNIRRKPPPRPAPEDEEGEGESGEMDTTVVVSPVKWDGVGGGTNRPSTMSGTPGQGRTPSGSKRMLSYEDATPTTDRRAAKRASIDSEGHGRHQQQQVGGVDDEARGRPSLSESETSTEQGHGHGHGTVPMSPQKLSIGGDDDGAASRQVIPKRSTSSVSRQRGVEEAKKRARAVEDSVRTIKDEVKRLRLDADADESPRTTKTGMKRSTARTGRALGEADLNLPSSSSPQTALSTLLTHICELETRLSSLTRMTDRLLPITPAAPSTSSSSEVSSLRAQVATLERKCALLTTLETDGRMENTELHKAFNEELDGMYEDTQRPESEELERLREEIKRVKRQRNEGSVRNKKLYRDLELEKVQCQVYREMLEENGLL